MPHKKLHAVFILLCTMTMAACGPGAAPRTPGTFCAAGAIVHEAQFSHDPTLQGTFDNVTVVQVEKNGATHAGDTAGAGIDIIPYHVTTEQTVQFSVGTAPLSTATIADAQGSIVTTFHPSDTAVPVRLPAGDYTLTVESDDTGGLLFIGPDICGASSDTATSNLAASPAKVAASGTTGVHIRSIADSNTIVGAGTNLTAFVGYTAQGPTNTATAIASYGDFENVFGSPSAESFVGLAVWQFFANGGAAAYVVSIPATADGTLPGSAALIGDAAQGTGLYALSNLSQLDLLVIPDLVRLTADDAAITAELAMAYVATTNSFFIIDPPLTITTSTGIMNWAARLFGNAAGSHAALYFPGLAVTFPGPAGASQIGAGGALAGLYTTTDEAIGVWQSPAGTSYPLFGAVTLLSTIDAAMLARLEQAGVNPLRNYLGYGNIVWGARSLQGTGVYTALATKRLAIFIQKSIEQSLAWVGYEANTAHLQSSIKSTVSAFLTNLWSSGALHGNTAAEAFYVTVDESNNPAASLAQGILYVDIGIAANKPAEFIVLRLQLQTLPSS